MSNRLFGWLTISQMLFVSHLILVLSITIGMSYSRYKDDWATKVAYLADMSTSHLAAYNTFFSGSVAGRNYANLLMQSTLDNLKAVPKLKFLEVSGHSDYSGLAVAVRYSIDKSKGWRLDIKPQEVKQLSEKLNRLTQALAQTPESNITHIKKLNYLINKVKIDLEVINENLKLQSISIPQPPVHKKDQAYYLDEETNLLHIQIDLRNKNGGTVRAVVEASELQQIKHDLLLNILIEATIALSTSFVLIYVITFWLVSPLKELASSMKQDIETIEQSMIPEIKRADEIGELARAYSSLITKIKNQLRILHYQTETDPLTGLGSRLKYQKHGAKFVHTELSKGNKVYIAACDIDHFKLFNDSYGHTEGDNTLTEVAVKMKSVIAPHELGCRLGGEEFAFIVSGENEAVLTEKVEALREAVSQLQIPHRGNAPYNIVTVSIGASVIDSPRDQVTIKQTEQILQNALKRADQLLYTAKGQGRNRVLISS